MGACAMGPGAEDLVDSRLRVLGVEGLRVVDASVFPSIPSAGNAAPTMALGWPAADFTLQDCS
ncbi:GMC oxidoreductase [Rhodococcus sp. NPDC059968]|uniref:GMC oxidoreductase n=1 Tax=Rhodococcus sp. NPDC059968 TaxID=3347017 RepID=UPI00366DC03E